jgi:hypothetical protein
MPSVLVVVAPVVVIVVPSLSVRVGGDGMGIEVKKDVPWTSLVRGEKIFYPEGLLRQKPVRLSRGSG